MDPVTQGALGAAAAQSAAKGRAMTTAMLSGWLAGMAADIDVLIRSSTDPLLFLEYHRHFTHSLIFIPVGGLVVALLLYHLLGKRRDWHLPDLVMYCILGYATHALLDACTSYGTMLLWPFSDKRFAWDNISIIDPAITLPVIALLLLAKRRGSPWPARGALVWVAAYLSIGLVQHDRAIAVATELAQSRGHQPIRIEAKPGFGNVLVFKSIYQTQHAHYVDAIRVGLSTRVYPGTSIARFDQARDLAWLNPDSQQARDLQRFDWFSDNWLAVHQDNALELIDMRYSMLPNEISSMWSIEFNRDAQADEHVLYKIQREDPSSKLKIYGRMLLGQDL